MGKSKLRQLRTGTVAEQALNLFFPSAIDFFLTKRILSTQLSPHVCPHGESLLVNKVQHPRRSSCIKPSQALNPCLLSNILTISLIR